METDPFISLLSELGDLMTCARLKRMLRKELINVPTKDLATKLASLELKLKNLSSVPSASRDPNWHARISELMLSAATQTINRASGDAFVELAVGTGHTMKVRDLQHIFRREWNDSYDRWLDLPKEIREQVEDHILGNMLLPENPSNMVERRRSVRGLINEAGKRSWILMKRSNYLKKRKRKMEGDGLEDGSGDGIVAVGEGGRKKRRTQIEAVGQNDDNSEEGGVRRKGVRGKKREPIWPLTCEKTVSVERDEPTKNNQGIVSGKAELAEQSKKDEEIEPPARVGSDKEEEVEPKREEEADGAQDVAHGQEEADVLRAESKETGINKRETEKLETPVQTSETAEAGLEDGEPNEIKTTERGMDVIIILSDDEQPQKIERVRKMQVIEIGSEDEWSCSQLEEPLHPSEPGDSLHPSDTEDSGAYFDYFGQ
ncbi:hypothetical protein DFP73DRAFT_563528 [Morchella snyderi]|nr:hypothetical protein DFP73DRAFT_563528 [Morchella snyderi]